MLDRLARFHRHRLREIFLYRSGEPFLPFSLEVATKVPLERLPLRLVALLHLLRRLTGCAPLAPLRPPASPTQRFLTLHLRLGGAAVLERLLLYRLLLCTPLRRRDLPFRSFLPTPSQWLCTFGELGELGLSAPPYDYFGWQQPVAFSFHFPSSAAPLLSAFAIRFRLRTMRYLLEKDRHRRSLFARQESRSSLFRALIHNQRLPLPFRCHLYETHLRWSPRGFGSRLRNRCIATGRAGSVYRTFRLSRMALREQVRLGRLPGVAKSSW